MPKRVLTSLAFVVAVLVLGGVALAAANSVSTKPAPAFISRLDQENARDATTAGVGAAEVEVVTTTPRRRRPARRP